MINDIFALSNDVRYVAIYRDGHLETKSKEDTIDASNSDSDPVYGYTRTKPKEENQPGKG